MSKISFTILMIGITIAAYRFGENAGKTPCDVTACKLTESRAIQGCELAAFSVNNQLSNCERRSNYYRDNLEQCVEELKECR